MALPDSSFSSPPVGPVVEFAHLPFPANLPLLDASSPAGSVWRNTLAGISRAEGFRGAFWGWRQGREEGDGDGVEILVEWDSKSIHEAFATSAAYRAISDPVVALTARTPSMYHATLSLGPLARALARHPDAVTEFATISIARGPDAQGVRDDFAHRFEALTAEGLLSAVGGWVVEELSSSSSEAGGGGDAFETCLVWETEEARTEGEEKVMEGLRKGGKIVRMDRRILALSILGATGM